MLRQVTGREIRELEPALGSRLVGGYLGPGEGAVDNRHCWPLWRPLLARAGGVWCPGASTRSPGWKVTGFSWRPVSDHRNLLPEWICTLPRARYYGCRPMRGRCRGRGMWCGPGWVTGWCNLVPRRGGIVVGATQYEPIDADDRAPRVSGWPTLLADALEVMPGLRTYDLAEAGVGMRPCTPDGLPIVREPTIG